MQRRRNVVEAWRVEGLALKDVYGSKGGNVGNSFDAQRLIFMARAQGREDECIEAIYKANHEDGLCLSDRTVLLAVAEAAGVLGANDMLESTQGIEEVEAKIRQYHQMGINSVPVCIIDEKYPIAGCPDTELLHSVFHQLIQQEPNSDS